jgi:hypothetical protein
VSLFTNLSNFAGLPSRGRAKKLRSSEARELVESSTTHAGSAGNVPVRAGVVFLDDGKQEAEKWGQKNLAGPPSSAEFFCPQSFCLAQRRF